LWLETLPKISKGDIMKKITELGRQYGGELAALLVVTIWGTNFVFMKASLQEFDVGTFVFLRYLGMLVLSWLIVYLSRRMKSDKAVKPTKVKISRKDFGRLALAGILGFSLYIPLSSVGLNYTTAFSTALLLGTSPLFASILLWLLRMEKVYSIQWVAMLIALAGVFIFVFDKLQVGIASASLGDLLSLAAAFFWAAYNVASKPLLNRYPATELTAYTLTIGSVPILLLTAPFLFGQDWSRVSLAGWGGLGWATFFPVYFAWTVWSWANRKVGVSRTTVFMYLVPIIGGATSWVLLGEEFGFLKIAGTALTILSLVVVRYGVRKRTQQQVKPAAVQAIAE
jgi:drug/metabolite transporter (DMT)-like permease